jgi:dCTP deaminase
MTPSPASPPTREILRRLADPDDDFTITPRPPTGAIGKGSVDLSLGRTFLVAVRVSVASVRVDDPERGSRLYAEVRRSDEDTLYVQPHQFVLACTMEYLRLPPTLCGFIQSRSTSGRLGLIAATATYVSAGYHGCPTLELTNVGEIPVAVKPRDRICQLVLFTADEDPADLTPSRYQCAIRPSAARRGP